eukprot:6909357-Pyramimonas_sp.AAC.1
MRDAGLQTAPSVEYFKDPLAQAGPQDDRNVLDPQVRERLLLDAGAAPGPDEANVYQLAPPCTTHSA